MQGAQEEAGGTIGGASQSHSGISSNASFETHVPESDAGGSDDMVGNPSF